MAVMLPHMSDPEPLLRSAYYAFNVRDIEATLELMQPQVDWPNALEVSRHRKRMAVDGRGWLFCYCRKARGQFVSAPGNARPKPSNSQNGRPARPPSTGHAIPEGA
jgi:hypothetical protein